MNNRFEKKSFYLYLKKNRLFFNIQIQNSLLSRVDGLAVACLLICLISLSTCCFITNCPPGGKRSVDESVIRRKCMPCGPGGLGQCLGPHICCGKHIGCQIFTKETHVCLRENSSPIPCSSGGKLCGKDGEGHCVSDGICCTEDRCTIDSSCVISNEDQSGENLEDFLQNILRRSSVYESGSKRDLVR